MRRLVRADRQRPWIVLEWLPTRPRRRRFKHDQCYRPSRFGTVLVGSDRSGCPPPCGALRAPIANVLGLCWNGCLRLRPRRRRFKHDQCYRPSRFGTVLVGSDRSGCPPPCGALRAPIGNPWNVLCWNGEFKSTYRFLATLGSRRERRRSRGVYSQGARRAERAASGGLWLRGRLITRKC